MQTRLMQTNGASPSLLHNVILPVTKKLLGSNRYSPNRFYFLLFIFHLDGVHKNSCQEELRTLYNKC